ncbi:MAG: hypothetical protein L0Z50_08935 [Verrucomicrobiales bacterium]|nr:hypothetical protein [Verrucomicrobiales bacterium]
MRRPGSLEEVATWSKDRRDFHRHLADFLDEFRAKRRSAMVAAEPSRLAPQFEGGEVCDAYLAAVAVSLAREIGFAPPTWAWAEDRKLKHPWFASPGPAIRAMLLWESPAPFRERNLFVSENALARA